jgi:hypothetical protein
VRETKGGSAVTADQDVFAGEDYRSDGLPPGAWRVLSRGMNLSNPLVYATVCFGNDQKNHENLRLT